MESNVRQFMVGFLLGLIAFLLVTLIGREASASSKDWVLGLDELSVEYRDHGLMGKSQRDPLLYPEAPKEYLQLNVNVDLLQVVGFDAAIGSYTTDAQYRSVGLNTKLYLRVSQMLDVGVWHFSQHLLDRQSGNLPAFPSEDALLIRLYLFRAKPGRDSIL